MSSSGGRTGGIRGWVRHDIPVTGLIGWADDGVGTWSEAGGVISQTDNTADSLIQWQTPLPAVEFIVEVPIRFPTGQDSGTVMAGIIAAGCQDQVAQGNSGTGGNIDGEGGVLIGSAAGDGAGVKASTWIDGNPAQGSDTYRWPTTIGQGEWHTLRAVVASMRQVLYLDGVYLVSSEDPSGGNTFDGNVPTRPNLVMLGAVGLVDFGPPVVWTPALPL